MRYMLLIYSREGTANTDQELAIALRHREVMNEARARGIFYGAEPLQATSTAVTVRKNGDQKVMVTDGPFAETKEQLAGYYILDCESLDEAIEWAAQIPTGCQGSEGCVEVRPIRTMKVAVD
ncbi:MAG TPA: YciI family protein [Pyrinomonadaceae bacterium]